MLKEDLRYAFRSFARTPGYTLVVLLTLALGIGGTTAVFSFANAALLRPMPFPEADRLVAIFSGSAQTTPYETSSYLDVMDWRKQMTSFEEVACFANWRELNLTGGDEPVRVLTGVVSPNYLPMLGIRPHLGRLFLPEEDRVPDGHPVVLLSHDLWEGSFGGDPGIIGRQIHLNDAPYTVVGVLPERFRDIASHGEVDLWVPLMMAPSIFAPSNVLEDRRNRWLSTTARLKPGVTIEEAQAELEVVTQRLVRQYPETNEGWSSHVAPFSVYLFQHRDINRSTLILIIGAGFVLLIGCVNIANLLIVRAATKHKEFALRLALGASRGRLIRQSLTESALLALTGGALGVLLAHWSLRFLFASSPIPMPNYIEVDIDGRVLAAVALVSILCGLSFGFAPAFSSSRVNLRGSLSEGGQKGTSTGRSSRVSRNALIITEVALAMVLLMGALLMIRSFLVFRGTGMGFETKNLLLAQTELSNLKYGNPQAQRNLYPLLVEKLRTIPGVLSAGLWGPERPGLSWAVGEILQEGRSPEEERVRAWVHRITPESLDVLGIPLVKGRKFTNQDVDGTPLVVLVSESLARIAWPGQDPIGKRFSRGTPDAPWMTVVGVVADARHRGRVAEYHDPKDIYMPFDQRPMTRLTLFVRTAGAPAQIAGPLRQAVKEIDPGITLFNLRTMDELQADEEDETRFYAKLMGFFAFIALVLAAIGIYGVLSYSVAHRTHEIGIRIALGARRQKVFSLIGGQAMRLVLVGLLLGLTGTFALTRIISSLLYEVEAFDPVNFAAISAVLMLVAVGAIYFPVRRALKVDPVVALRQE